MRGFYFENHKNLRIVEGTGFNLVGELTLEAGSYMVWGKLNIGVSVDERPDWPFATGLAVLVLGNADDNGSFGVKPNLAENSHTLNLMCAATITRARRARLYVTNLRKLHVICSDIKLMALQIDTLTETELGRDPQVAPEDEDEVLRNAIWTGRSSQPLIRDFIDDD